MDIYIVVARLAGDLRDDIDYGSADSFIGAFSNAGAALDAARARIAESQKLGISDGYEVIKTRVYDDVKSFDSRGHRESIATLFTE